MNQERRAKNCLDQSEEFHEAEKKQRRSRSTNQTRLAGSIGGRLVTPEGRTFFGLIPFRRILHQLRTTDQPIRLLHRSNWDGLSLDGLSSDGLSFRSETPKIGTSHEWSRTACVTQSTIPLEYNTSSKETVGNGGRSRSTRKSRTFTCALSRYTHKSRTFTCAFSRTSYAQVVHRTHKSLYFFYFLAPSFT